MVRFLSSLSAGTPGVIPSGIVRAVAAPVSALFATSRTAPAAGNVAEPIFRLRERGWQHLLRALRKLALGPRSCPPPPLSKARNAAISRNSGIVRKLDHPVRRSVSLSSLPTSCSSSSSGFVSAARRILVDGVLRRVTNSQASELRRVAARNLLSGQSSAPFLALVGVSLASGSGTTGWTIWNWLIILCMYYM